MLPVPVIEFFHLIMWLMKNRPFLYIGRYFCLSVIALAAIGCTSEWIIPLDPNSTACIIGKFECYKGPPLSLSEFVFATGASKILFFLPAIYVFAALLLAFQHPRTYLFLLLLSISSLVILIFSEPNPEIYYLNGLGNWLHFLGLSYLLTLSFPLAIHEQMTLYTNYDYQGIFRYFPGYKPQ